MKPKILLALFLGLFSVPALAECPDPLPVDQMCLEWQAPTQNVDGTPLTDLAGYNVYATFVAGDYSGVSPLNIADSTIEEHTITSLSTEVTIPNPGPDGGVVPVYVVMTAYDDDGNESAFSNEVGFDVTFPDTVEPGEPVVITLIISVASG